MAQTTRWAPSLLIFGHDALASLGRIVLRDIPSPMTDCNPVLRATKRIFFMIDEIMYLYNAMKYAMHTAAETAFVKGSAT